MLIEQLAPADCEAVRELAEQAGSDVDPAAELERSFARLWVARPASEAAPFGFALVWSAVDERHLLDLVVAAAQRRRGIGRRLLGHVVEQARLTGARLVLLEVRASNAAALALYRSAGFFVTGVRHAYYSDNEDAIEMRLELTRPSNPGAAP